MLFKPLVSAALAGFLLPVLSFAAPVETTDLPHALEERQSGGGSPVWPNPGGPFPGWLPQFPWGTLPPAEVVFTRYMHPGNSGRPCLFYNIPRGYYTHEQIANIAAGLEADSLYDIYYPDDSPNSPFNSSISPMREVVAASNERDWFRWTSRLFARRCTNRRAYLMWAPGQPFQNPAQNWRAIWSTDEFDEIQRNGPDHGIQEVYLVDPATGHAATTPFWTRGQPIPEDWYQFLPGANAPDPPRKRDALPLPQTAASPSVKRDDILPPPSTAAPQLQREELNISTAINVPADAHALTKRTAPNIRAFPELTVFTGNPHGWVPGVCGFHWTQIVSNNGYAMNVQMFDYAATNNIGSMDLDVQAGLTFQVNSRLQWALIVTTGQSLNDPLKFAWAGQKWDTTSADNCVGQSPPSGRGRTGTCYFFCNIFS